MIAAILMDTESGANNSFERRHAMGRPFVVKVSGEFLRKNNRIRRYIDRPAAERAIIAMGHEVQDAA